MAKFKEDKPIKTHVHPLPGNFAMEMPEPEKDVHWDHCREQFASKFKDTTVGFYFVHTFGKGLDVAEFITKFEKIVGIKETSVFSKTNKNNVIWIEPAKFWMNCQMKLSLLTIILRCGMNYNYEKDNFDDALFGEHKESKYVLETKNAILRFMFGFTQFVGQISFIAPSASLIKHGWREEFKSLDPSAVRQKLVLPEGETKETSIIGIDSLWL